MFRPMIVLIVLGFLLCIRLLEIEIGFGIVEAADRFDGNDVQTFLDTSTATRQVCGWGPHKNYVL